MHCKFTTPKFFIALNESLVGCFKRMKGLRQWRCLPDSCRREWLIKVYSSIIPNVFMVIVAANVPSIQIIKEVLSEFQSLSGLTANR
jgi:hypothetical protein